MPIAPRDFLPLHANWFHILLSLVGKEQHGYGIMQEVLERTNGAVRLWPATLYGSPHRRRGGGGGGGGAVGPALSLGLWEAAGGGGVEGGGGGAAGGGLGGRPPPTARWGEP